MAMSYDSALIVGTDIVALTGVQDLSNLAADGELVLNTFVLEAHRAIYRRLEAKGVTPALLDNQDRLKSAVAYEALKRLALGGYLGEKGAAPVDYQAEVDRELSAFRPEYTDSSDEPANALNAGIPSVGNFESGWVFGPGESGPTGQRYWGDLPSAR